MHRRTKKNFLVKFFKRFAKRAPILFRRQQKKVARFFRVFKKSFLNPIGTYISEKYSKIKNPILLTRLATIAIVIAMIGGFSYRVFATPPTSPYTAGETLNPTCAPGDANCTVTTSGASGSGTTGYIPKWTGSSTLGDSMIKDTGSRIEIGTVEAGITGGALVVGGNILPSNLTANVSSYTLGDFSVVWGGVHTDYVRGSGGIFNITGSSSKAIFSDNDTGGLGVVIKSHGTQVAQFGDGTNPYVGIGTASPTYSLHVVGNSRIETGSGKYVTIDSVDSGNGVSLLLSGSASDIIGISSFNTYFNQGKVFLYGYSSIAGGTDANRGDFLFRNEYNSTNLMYLSSDGKLGIGTTTPSSKIDITTTGLGVTQTTTSGLALVNTSVATAGAQQISPAIRWSGNGWKTNATAGSQAVDFRSYVLPVQGTANPSGRLVFESSINGGAYTANQLVLSSSGNVGIGVVDPQYALDVNGSIRLNSGSIVSQDGYGILIDYGNHNISIGAAGSNGALFLGSPYGNDVFVGINHNMSVFQNDGNFGLNTQTPNSLLQVDQAGYGPGGVLVTTSSATITGTDTQFTNTFKVGDTITVVTDFATETKTIATISSDTSMTVTSPFSGQSASATSSYQLTGGTRFVVKGNGNIGIGTTSPTTILEIGSSDMGDGVAGSVITLGRNTNATNTGAGSIDFLQKDGTHGYVWQDDSGVLRINTSSPSNANDTAGTIVGSQSSSLSSKNLVAEFTDYKTALQTIIDAPLYDFTYKSGAFNNQQFTGIITDYTPEFGMDRDATHPAGKSLNVITGLGYTFGAIKELNLKIENLNLQIEGIYAILTPQSNVLGMMTEFFSSVVSQVSGGIGYLKNITIETLKIGSPEKRTGITLFDEVTGEPYCISVANGAQKISSGECSVIMSQTDTGDETNGGGATAGDVSSGGDSGIFSEPILPDESGSGDVMVGDSVPTDTQNSSGDTVPTDTSNSLDTSAEILPTEEVAPSVTTDTSDQPETVSF